MAATLDSIAATLADMQLQINELWQLQGLDRDNPMNVTPYKREVGEIYMAITGIAKKDITVTRANQPQVNIFDENNNFIADENDNLIIG